MTDRQLINLAEQASRNAYVPYSHFAVGAALECRDGTVFTGCNIENAALGSTICAERTAACKAVVRLDELCRAHGDVQGGQRGRAGIHRDCDCLA